MYAMHSTNVSIDFSLKYEGAVAEILAASID